MPPIRQQSANKAFKPPRQLKNQPTAVEAGPSQTATSRNQARVALGRAGPSSTTVRPGAAFKPATTVISSSPIVMSDIEDDFSADDLNGTSLATAPRRRRISSAHRGSPSRHQETALPPSQDALGATAKDPIPAKLLNALLHEEFEDKEMRIGKEAMAVTQKYVETFVREALARAMIGRQTEEESVGGAGDGFLQVSYGLDESRAGRCKLTGCPTCRLKTSKSWRRNCFWTFDQRSRAGLKTCKPHRSTTTLPQYPSCKLP
ncbi:hypothetical protein IWX50DRAFT_613467 [Phyllosticta citricarpa]